MTGKLWRWLRGTRPDRGGYRCDDCGRWRARRDHPRARVVTVRRTIPAAGPWPELEHDALLLLCGECADRRAGGKTELAPRGTATGRAQCPTPNLARVPPRREEAAR